MKQNKMWVDLEVTDFDPRIGGITQCSIIIEQVMMYRVFVICIWLLLKNINGI